MFIDFGSAVLFPPEVTDQIVNKQPTSPPKEFVAPEQEDSHVPYDIFAADIYNLGKVLEMELCETNKVCQIRDRLNATAFLLSVYRIPQLESQCLQSTWV